MEWQATQAHNHLPLLPPKSEFETVAILKACIPARAALLPHSKSSRKWLSKTSNRLSLLKAAL
ncbi:hypothetical protein [uncultured Shewanella sp.]|uniref:hypothetical protein n=1 Tax=uncultured Shewanella sp. TaxID=173975 RepID=UPI003454B977